MDDKTEVLQTKPDGPWVAHALKPGHAILEYVVERTLGGGGFGITYLARDANLNLPVAVKEYLPTDLAMRAADGSVQALSASSGEQFNWGLERFLSEARVLAAFRHPNIVRALRYFPANGTAYIVMEFETGESLKKWLPRQGRLDQAALLKMIHPLLDGLELMHNAGYLHRDIKPDNIYMRSDNSPVLIDFGSARSTSTGGEMTSIVSPGFAPFEQYQTKGNQGPWTDIYSLAAVMYWLVSGEKPLSSIERLKQDGMVPASRLDRHKQMNESLLDAIDWALNMDETRRPQSVAEFRQRLQAAGLDNKGALPVHDNPGVSVMDVPVISGKNASAMEYQGNNLVCSILFMDIIAYSKTSVNEQYQLKSSFNQLISGKLAHVPDSSRITLDTGDGAVICFMGDPEEVLYASRDIQRTLAQQDRLQVRMGLHIGPVRILIDLNGHNNVIGDGINVAQRVMSFANNNSLVVSRAFYEMVACITDGGERGFSYLGERRDKHDRAHEIYAVISGVEHAFDQTIALNGHSPTVNNAIDAEVILGVEKELAKLLGPLAPVLMRKVKARAGNEQELRNLLAQSISDPVQKQQFIQGAQGNNPNQDAGNSRANSSPGQKFANSAPVNSSPVTSVPVSKPSQPNSGSAPPAWLPAEAAGALEKLLAKTIGPMAKVLVKNEARKNGDLNQLCQALSMHIDNADLRSQFVREASALRYLKS